MENSYFFKFHIIQSILQTQLYTSLIIVSVKWASLLIKLKNKIKYQIWGRNTIQNKCQEVIMKILKVEHLRTYPLLIAPAINIVRTSDDSML